MSRKIIARAALSLILISTIALAACSDASASKTSNKSEGPPVSRAPVASPSSGSLTPETPTTIAKARTGRIKATWITPGKDGDNTIIPVSAIKSNVIVHFFLEAKDGKMPFMAYEFEEKIWVRADICVPCRSYNYSLEKDILVCDACDTRFSARTGAGISGACVRYPKEAAKYVTSDNNIVIADKDLETAFFGTLEPG